MSKDKFYEWLQSGKNHILAEAMITNALYLAAMLLLFCPQLGTDDFLMANKAYGVNGSDYDFRCVYMNFIYGRLLVLLMRLAPGIPWYTVMFYILLFVAYTLFAYVILSWDNSYVGKIIVHLVLLYFSFEGYAAIQFTKVAGILGAIAILALLVDQVGLPEKVIALILLGFSCMIRYQCAQMAIGAWALALGCKILLDRMRDSRHWLPQNKKAILWMLAGVGVFLLIPKMSLIGMSEDERLYWSSYYWNNNAMRSLVQDLDVPDYEKNQAVYDKLGISKNDLYIWRSWNWDSYAVTLKQGEILQALADGDEEACNRLLSQYQDEGGGEWHEQLKAIEDTKAEASVPFGRRYLTAITDLIQKVCDMQSISSFFKVFPKAFLNIDVFMAYMGLILFLFFCGIAKNKQILWGTAVSCGVYMLLNYYLYIHLRYLQHRVDVGMLMATIGILLYFVLEVPKCMPNDHRRAKMVGCFCLLLLVLSGKYRYYGEDQEKISETDMQNNQMFFQEASEDGENSYVWTSDRYHGLPVMMFYHALDTPRVGALANIQPMGNVQPYIDEPQNDRILDLVDQDAYLVLIDANQDEAAWQTYASEHFGQDVELSLVKHYLGKKLYRARSQSVQDAVQLPPENTSQENIISDLDVTLSDDRLKLSGSAYLQGESGFQQNTYIRITDKKTKQSILYDTLATCDSGKKYGDDGYFSYITCNIDLPEFYSEGDAVELVIEQEGKCRVQELQIGGIAYERTDDKKTPLEVHG